DYYCLTWNYSLSAWVF
nr:immunoglobulin light chain junction region [Macaca mulatta]MOY05024.1 immunoglobulin light chain junction region [Macaca mulatta]MOY05177.1 immunoglobulin light chain junction region [Macaca mulatta]MOY07999.1 immunoglobulin light chain junction region [Macaca mulatta]MOY08120.1 immunoglobulin light chain junction region [Macaca mulatta]